MTFKRWWDGISNIANNEEIYKIGNGNIKLFMRSIHHMPIGDEVGSCQDGRPIDWRSPTVVEGYNAVLQMVVDNKQKS